MKSNRIITSTFLAALLFAGATACAAPENTTTTIKFSDPSKPGTLKVDLMMADIRIVGADTSEISVRADTAIDDGTPQRKDGLRSIGGGSSFRLSESNNVVTLNSGDIFGGHGHGGATFDIIVPRATAIVLMVLHGGDTVVRGVSGNVEISNANGDMKLEDLSGGVAADTMNGEITASFAQLTEGRTYSFASMNGEIDLRVPASAKASVRFRAQVGEVLTDFDETQLVTRLGPAVVVEGVEGAEVAMAPVPPVPPVPPVAASEGVRPPKAPKPPRGFSFPAFGGQVVTGTLNGGGPELIATTMRGTITLRKSD